MQLPPNPHREIWAIAFCGLQPREARAEPLSRIQERLAGPVAFEAGKPVWCETLRHRAIGRVLALSLRSRKPFLDNLPLLFEAVACNVVSILLGDVLERADGGQQLLKRLSARLTMLRNGDST